MFMYARFIRTYEKRNGQDEPCNPFFVVQ